MDTTSFFESVWVMKVGLWSHWLLCPPTEIQKPGLCWGTQGCTDLTRSFLTEKAPPTHCSFWEHAEESSHLASLSSLQVLSGEVGVCGGALFRIIAPSCGLFLDHIDF